MSPGKLARVFFAVRRKARGSRIGCPPINRLSFVASKLPIPMAPYTAQPLPATH